MKKKSSVTPGKGVYAFGILGIVCIVGAYTVSLTQAAYYSILTIGLALLLAALVELRFDIIEGKLDELAKAHSKES